MTRIAMLSMHTSPLAQLGVGNGGGMNVYVKELAHRLNSYGARVDVYTGSHGVKPDIVDLRTGLRVHHIDLSAIHSGRVQDRAELFADQVEKSIDRTGADILHAHYWHSGIAGHILKHRTEKPLVTTFHTLSRVKAEAGIAEHDAERNAAERAILGCSDAVIANDNAEAADLLRLYNAEVGHIHVIAPGVDTQRFAPRNRSTTRAALELPSHRPVVLFVGRIQPIKGADLAIEALDQLRQSRPDVLLVVLGGPSGPSGQATLDSLKSRINVLGLQDNVRFVGPQSPDALACWYNAADIAVMPSRSESFGFVALEASASGLPVVATAVGALPSIVADGNTGYVVPPEDSAAVANALDKLLSDPSSAADMGRRGAQRAQLFSWATTARRTNALYDQLLDSTVFASARADCVSA